MEVSEIAAAVAPAPAPTAAASRSTLSQEDFFQIMISELVNQDPLEPMDNGQMLDQLTQLQNLEATSKLTEGIEALLLGQQISSAGVLIGQQVTGVNNDGDIVDGLVSKVTVLNDEVSVQVDGHQIPLRLVREVSAPLTQVPTEE